LIFVCENAIIFGMLQRKAIICLLGLMCFSPVSGFLMVICHGSDGHMAVELAVHDHCECPEAGSSGEFAFVAVGSQTDHEHCEDTIATSSVVVGVRKNIKQSIHKILTANLSPESDTSDSSFNHSLARRGCGLSSFYRPLRTVIILV
jgi:hypothetical protein